MRLALPTSDISNDVHPVCSLCVLDSFAAIRRDYVGAIFLSWVLQRVLRQASQPNLVRRLNDFANRQPADSCNRFAVFQAASMANNCGLSLVDTSLTTFQTTYIMLIPAVLLILSGDIAFPIA